MSFFRANIAASKRTPLTVNSAPSEATDATLVSSPTVTRHATFSMCVGLERGEIRMSQNLDLGKEEVRMRVKVREI